MSNTNLSFEQIRQAMSATPISSAPSAAFQKTKKVVSAVGSFVGGVMPVTHNGMDERTERLLELLVVTQHDLYTLRQQLGIESDISDLSEEEVVDSVAAYMSMIKKKKKEKTTPAVTAPQSALETLISGNKEDITQMLNKAPEQAQMPQTTPTQPVVESAKPQAAGDTVISMDQPTNWHQM